MLSTKITPELKSFLLENGWTKCNEEFYEFDTLDLRTYTSWDKFYWGLFDYTDDHIASLKAEEVLDFQGFYSLLTSFIDESNDKIKEIQEIGSKIGLMRERARNITTPRF